MTLLTTTTHTYSTGYGSAGGQREDLSDVIYELFPEDTWALENWTCPDFVYLLY